MQDTNTKIPEIRFPEFSGEWVEKKLKDIGDAIIGLTYSPKDINNNGIIVLRSSNIKDNRLDLSDLVKVNKKIPEKLKLKNNDIVICVRNGSQSLIGKSIIVKNPKNMTFGAFMSVFRSNYNKFVYYLFQTKSYKKQIYQNLGARINQVTNKHLLNFKFFIPLTLAEQRKIAEFLSKIDEKIEIATKKIDKLKQYKKGLLQKMLNVTDKGEPELRFKEFSGKWVEKRLGEVGEFFNGKSYESYIVENGAYNLITLNSITLEGKLSSTHKKVNVTNNFLRKNDLVIIMSDVAKGNFLGKVATIPDNNQYVLNQRVGGIRIKKDYNYLFIAYYINNKQKYFKKIGQGSSQKNISTNDIKNFKLYLPPTLEEQQKIADFLSSIDEKIELNENKLKALKKYKQGLLQKMFV